MNKIIIDKLNKYFNNDEINELLNNLNNKQRSNIINNNYFAKIGNNSNKLFFNNLIKEIDLYKNNKNNNIPLIVDSYIDSNFCLLILKRIEGNTIGSNRNQFNINLSKKKKLLIINNILNIKNLNVNLEIDKKYNRKEKLEKYLSNTNKYISKNTLNKITNNINEISKDTENVISHGDLIPNNILLNNEQVYFIDWEYISYKPISYDLTYFLLFSKKYNSLDIIDSITLNFDKKDIYRDGIIICLKEINNWIKLIDKIDNDIVEKNIKRWNRELNFILKKL
ncbi:MAG: phosphotransferase [Tenericutes bacterium]|nr:phosphotransferase [Bacilli bacterium]NLV90258.1 phosphotransferase [Mycoplasmatota bacterium]